MICANRISRLCSDSSVWSEAERAAFKIPRRLKPSEWSTQQLELPKAVSPNAAGPWDPTLAPYLNEVMDTCAMQGIHTVVFISVPQSGKSQVARNILAHRIDQNPTDTLIIFPDEDAVSKNLDKKIRPMLEADENESLNRHFTARAHDVKKDEIQLDHMIIRTGSARTAQSLASDPYGLIIADETGKYPLRTGRETNAIALARHRATTYIDHLVYIVTTPVDEAELGWQEYEGCRDKRLYWVPCPHCGAYQTLDWQQMTWCKADEVRRIIQEHAGEPLDELQARLAEAGLDVEIDQLESSPEDTIDVLEIPDDDDRAACADWVNVHDLAWMECKDCGGRIRDAHKHEMLNRGRWLSAGQTIDRRGRITGRRPRSSRVGFRLPAMYSPWVRFAEIAGDWIRAQGRVDLLIDFYNGRLAEPYREAVQHVKRDVYDVKAREMAELVESGAEPPWAVVPRWAALLVLTVDTQKDDFWWLLRAYGAGGRRKLIEFGKRFSFNELSELLNQAWPLAGDDGLTMRPMRLLIDTGGGQFTSEADADDHSRTNEIYRWTLTDPRIVAMKGEGRLDAPPYRFSTLFKEKRDLAVSLCLHNTNYWKDVLARQIRSEQWLICEEGAPELRTYKRHMTAERRVVIARGRYKGRHRWEPVTDSAANHLWDCEVLQAIAADMVEAYQLPSLNDLEAQRREYRARVARQRRGDSGRRRDSWLPPVDGDWSYPA